MPGTTYIHKTINCEIVYQYTKYMILARLERIQCHADVLDATDSSQSRGYIHTSEDTAAVPTAAAAPATADN